MSTLQNIWSSESLSLDIDDFRERGFNDLYLFLMDKKSSFNAQLPEFDLTTLYGINTRLASISRAFLNLLTPVKYRFILSNMINDIVEIIKYSQNELFDLKSITDFIKYESLINEISQFGKNKLKTKIEDYPQAILVFLLQMVIQERIESLPANIGKAENLIESILIYPSIKESSHDNEAIIYCLSRNNKSKRVSCFLDYYTSGKINDINSDAHSRDTQIKKLLKKKETDIKDCIKYYSDEFQNSIKVPDLLEESRSLRITQYNSVLLLKSVLSQRPGGTMYRNPPEVSFDLSRPFSLFKSESAIILMHHILEQLLRACHKFLNKAPDDIPLSDIALHDENYIKSRIDPLGMASFFVFGCHRIASNLVREETYDKSVKFLNKWQRSFKEEDNCLITSAAMALHAMYVSGAISKEFGERVKKWLLFKQHRYGHWYQDGNNKPLNTSVLILDAIELANKTPEVTFDPSFAYPLGSIRQNTKLYVELNLESRQLTIGTNVYELENKIWNLMTELVFCKKLVKVLHPKGDDRQSNWKNAVDMLRRKLKQDFKYVVQTAKGHGYRLNPNVKIIGDSQIAIRRTFVKQAPEDERKGREKEMGREEEVDELEKELNEDNY